jgi:hypothetical protein
MSVEAASLSRTVSVMRPMVPAKDFDTSKRFCIELGFRPRPLTDRLVEVQLVKIQAPQSQGWAVVAGIIDSSGALWRFAQTQA